MWQKKRISRLKQPPAVFSFYMMTQNGEITYPTNMEQWLTLANKLIQGDAEAVKAGYPAMSNPSAVELQAILDTTQSEYNDVAMADRDHDIVQENLAKHRTVADKLINEMFDQLNFSLRAFDASSQRRIIRTYGFKYDSLPGEEEPPPTQPENSDL